MPTKITYITSDGKVFRTIAPIEVDLKNSNDTIAVAHYLSKHKDCESIRDYSYKSTKLTGYKGVVNKLIKNKHSI